MKIPGEVKIQEPDKATVDRLFKIRPYVRQSGDCIRGKWHLGERCLFDYLLVCIIHGYGVFKVGAGDYFPVNDNDIVWVPPNCPHEMSGLSDKMHLAFIHFDLLYRGKESHWDAHLPAGFFIKGKLLKKVHPSINDPILSKLSGKLSITDSSEIISLARRICFIHKVHGNKAAFKLSAIMSELISIIIEQLSSGRRNALHSNKLYEAYKMLSDSTDDRDSISKIAKKIGMSESHFRRLFRQQFGVSPVHLRNKDRMQRGYDLMVYEGLNVSETAERLGFSGVANFSRAFKLYFGVSPKNIIRFSS